MKSNRVTAIVLAAGLSTRMGGNPKPLLPYGNRTIIEHIVHTLNSCGLDDVVIVGGHYYHALKQRLAGKSVNIVLNPNYTNGEMFESLQAGLRSASAHSDAALFLLGDQPALEAHVVASVIGAYREGRGRVVIPSFQMRRGHPILIAHEHWQTILGLGEGKTMRDFMRAVNSQIYHVEVNTPSILRDMDTPEEYQRELAEYHQRQLAFAPAE